MRVATLTWEEQCFKKVEQEVILALRGRFSEDFVQQGLVTYRGIGG